MKPLKPSPENVTPRMRVRPSTQEHCDRQVTCIGWFAHIFSALHQNVFDMYQHASHQISVCFNLCMLAVVATKTVRAQIKKTKTHLSVDEVPTSRCISSASNCCMAPKLEKERTVLSSLLERRVRRCPPPPGLGGRCALPLLEEQTPRPSCRTGSESSKAACQRQLCHLATPMDSLLIQSAQRRLGDRTPPLLRAPSEKEESAR
jgi:hypothetical protein